MDFSFPIDFRFRRAVDPFNWSSKLSNFNIYNPPADEQDEPDQGINFSQLYEEPGPAYKAYTEFLQRAPKIEDYQPSKWRRLGAILSGISSSLGGGSGYETARDMLLDPYKQAYNRWAESGAGIKEAAGMEQEEARNRASMIQKRLDFILDQMYKTGQLANDRERINVQREGQVGLADQRTASAEASRAAAALSRGRLGELPARLDLDRFQANTGRIGANASAANSRTNQDRLKWDTSVLNPQNIVDSARANYYNNPQQDFIPQGEIDKATQRVLENLKRNPEYSRYIISSASKNGGFTVDSRAPIEIKEQILDFIDQQLNRKR